MQLDPFLIALFFFLIAVATIFFTADKIIKSISTYAQKIGISETLTGMLVVGIAASLPEISSSITGLALKDNTIAIGTILGAIAAHLALATGIIFCLAKKMTINIKPLGKNIIGIAILTILPFALLFDGTLSRIDGIILITGYALLISLIVYEEKKSGKLKKDIPLKKIYKQGTIFIGSLAILLFAGVLLVVMAKKIIPLPEYLLSIAVIGIAGTMPDFAVGLQSIKQKHATLGIGEILGSTILELALFLGIAALIKPITIPFNIIAGAGAVITIAMITLLATAIKGKATWKQGIILLSLYTLFIAIEIGKALN